MSKKSLFRTPFKKRHGKRFQTLLKSSDQHLYYIHSSLRKQLSWKETLLVIYKDLGLFVNTLTADDKYSLLSRDNLTQKFLMKLPKKEKATSRVSAAFLKSRLYFEYFPKKKKMTFIASAFPRLRTPKDMVTWMSKKSCFRRPFNKEHGKQDQTLLKSESQHLYHLYWSMWRQLGWKKSLLVTSKILGPFVNTQSIGDTSSLLNKDN